MRERRFLIIGASGFIGTRLRAALGARRSMATYYTRPIPDAVFFNPLTMRLNDIVQLDGAGFTHAFILYAMTSIDECARHQVESYKVNVASQMMVIDDLVAHGIVPVVASSDVVFDGSRGMYAEDDAIDPMLTYGYQKACLERCVAIGRDPYIVARLSKVIDPTPGAGELLNQWMDQLEGDTPIRCARDQVFSPIVAADAVHAMIALAERGLNGVFNVCGHQAVTRIDLLQQLADAMREYRDDLAPIAACSIRDFDFAEPRPLDTSMSPRKVCDTLGREFESMASACARAARLRYATAPVPVT